MKKIPFLLPLAFTLFFLPIRSHSISIITDNSYSEIRIEKDFRVDKFVKIPITQLKKLTGKKLNLFQRLSYNLLKLKVKHNLKKDPNFKLNNDISEPRKKRAGWTVAITILLILFVLGLLALAGAFSFSWT